MARRRGTAFQRDALLDEHELDESSYDTSFVLDPAKLFDELPQPFRLIDKTVDYVFDKAWEAILELELRAHELGSGGKLPVFDGVEEMSDFYQATVMCCSKDGKFVFLVAKNGIIYALDAGTSAVAAYNDELQGVNVETMSTGYLQDNKHLVCILMENGTAAIFALSESNLHLIRVFNDDFGTKGSFTNYIEVSFDGNFLAVGWKIPLKSSWLEIYKIPKEFWMNEVSLIEEKMSKRPDHQETTSASIKEEEDAPKPDVNHTLENDSSDSENESGSRPVSADQSGAQTGYLSDTSFTKPTLMLKIKSPTDPVPNPACNITSALRSLDQDYDVIGTGTNHVLLQSYFDNSDKMFKERHQQYLQYLAEKEEDYSTRLPKVLFLTPGRFIPTGMQTSPDQVNSVVVHWSGDCHGLVYSLVKSAKDVERKPDVVLMTSSKILVSDVSVCKSFISLGTENDNIMTWDKLTGLPLTVVNLPTTSSITALHFIPTIKDGTCAKSYPSLLACCADGALYMMKYSDEGQTTIVNLPSSSIKMRDPIVQVTFLSNLPQLVLIQRRSGEIMLLDVSKKVLICQIGLPKPLKILNGFCYAHATSNLYIRGGRKDEYNEYVLPESICVYKIGVDTFFVVKTFLDGSNKVESSRTLEGFDQRIAAIEQQRASSYEKRQKNHKTRWRQLENELKRIKRPETLKKSLWFTGSFEV